jgi:hypothetical protein
MALGCSAIGLSVGADRAYTPGFSMALKLGGDLHDALPQKFFDQLDPLPIALQPQDLPVICPVAVKADKRLQRQVELSAGFIDLVNRLCHAKAIEKVQPGFFNQYVANLARIAAVDASAPAPPIVEPRYWTEDILNDQLSTFNQMMGMMMAINMAHHYLGHYDRYGAKLNGPGNKLLPINNFLTASEWDASVKAGALDALNCALSTEGLRVIFEALDKMPVRPSWADYIAPHFITDFKKLNKDLAKYEEDFFHGRIKN